MLTVIITAILTRPDLICNRSPASFSSGRALTLLPPSSDVAVFSGGKYDFFSVKEAKGSHNLFSVSARQPNAVLHRRHFLAAAVVGQ